MKSELKIDQVTIDSINAFLAGHDNPVIEDLAKVVDKYGGPQAINQAAAENGRLEKLLDRVRKGNPRYADDLQWLSEQKAARKFISMEEFAKNAGRPVPSWTPATR